MHARCLTKVLTEKTVQKAYVSAGIESGADEIAGTEEELVEVT